MRRPTPARARAGALSLLAALPFAAGCGEEPPLPDACLGAQPADVLAALRGAPQDAALADGTRLSTCVDLANDDAALQTLAITLVAVADELAGRAAADGEAAYRLGFLIGAAERGAGPTGGTRAELLQRLEQAVTFQAGSAARRRDLLRGEADGRRSG